MRILLISFLVPVFLFSTVSKANEVGVFHQEAGETGATPIETVLKGNPDFAITCAGILGASGALIASVMLTREYAPYVFLATTTGGTVLLYFLAKWLYRGQVNFVKPSGEAVTIRVDREDFYKLLFISAGKPLYVPSLDEMKYPERVVLLTEGKKFLGFSVWFSQFDKAPLKVSLNDLELD